MIRMSCLAVVALSAAAPLSAGQPLSESMVQCGALYTVAAGWVDRDGTREKLLDAAEAWAVSAEARAATEGRSDPAGYVDAMWPVKCSAWSQKHRAYVFTGDFRDWMSYCRALAKHENVPLPGS
ncbi:hypothetical protein [Roseobacter ponti]|uniref:Uncharacterized protein n=1 Tax=Roseobacter ponti TaxID=1891787 RepID=A0A858SSR2_9RHOB|nr:hypothetical protein [Roseobacter ponti]QJF50631.1 hypothetical protein G3256_05390 [Roseobacter ponti]